MLIGYPSVASLVICLIALLGAAVVFGNAAIKRFRQRDRYGTCQGILGVLGFGLLPYSIYLGPFQSLVVLMVVAASVMGLRGHIR